MHGAEASSGRTWDPSMAVMTSPGSKAPLSHAAPPLRICAVKWLPRTDFVIERSEDLIHANSLSNYIQRRGYSAGGLIIFQPMPLTVLSYGHYLL